MKRLTLSLASGIALVLALVSLTGLTGAQYILGDGLYDQNGKALPFVTLTGSWSESSATNMWYGPALAANGTGGSDTYSFSFRGDKLVLWLFKCGTCGTAGICIDESPPCSTTINTNSGTATPFEVTFSGLTPDVHSVQIVTISGNTIIDAIYIECGDCGGGGMDEIVVTVQVEVTAEVIIEMTEEPYVQTWELVDSEENAQIVAFKYQADIGQLATIILLFGILLLVFTNTVLNTWRHINHDDD